MVRCGPPAELPIALLIAQPWHLPRTSVATTECSIHPSGGPATPPAAMSDRILLAHGGGGSVMQQMIRQELLPLCGRPEG